jgi:hypothetical protein
MQSLRRTFSLLCVFLSAAACTNLADLAPPMFKTNVSSLPLFDTTLVFQSFLSADTTFLRRDAQTGNLVFVQERDIPAGRVGDSLKISTLPLAATVEFGNRPEIAALIQSLANITVPISDLLPPLPRSTTTPLPFPGTPQQGVNIRRAVALGSDIESLTLTSARVRLRMTNRLPFPVEIRPISGENAAGVRFTPRSGSASILFAIPDSQRTVQSGDSLVVTQTLSNIVIANGASVETQVFAAARSSIAYGDTAGISVSVSLEEPVVSEARVSLPSRSFRFLTTVPLAGGTRLQSARLQALSAALTVDNGFEITGAAIISAPQLRTQAGTTFQQAIRIERGMNRFTLSSAAPLDLVPDSLDRVRGGIIDSLRLVVTLQNDSVIAPRRITVRQSDKISLGGVLSETRLDFARGVSLPSITFNLASEVDFALTPELEKLGFMEVLAEQLQLELRLVNTAGADGLLSGTAYLLGSRPRPMDSLVITNQEVKRATEQNGRLLPVTTILKTSRANIRLTEFPRRVSVQARGQLLQNRPFFIERTSTVGGTALMTIPLAVRVTGGRYNDTIPLDLRSTIETAQKNIDSAALFLQMQNRLPASAELRIHFLDNARKTLLVLPAGESLRLPSASINAAGQRVPTPNEQTISLSPQNLASLQNARYLALEVKFSTPSTMPFARFQTQDFVRVRASLSLRLKTP